MQTSPRQTASVNKWALIGKPIQQTQASFSDIPEQIQQIEYM